MNKQEAIDKCDKKVLAEIKDGNAIHGYSIGNSSVRYKINAAPNMVVSEVFEFTPPAPEYEAGIVGYFSDNDNGLMLGKLNRVLDNGKYEFRPHNSVLCSEFACFTPLPIYAQLEQTKKALGLACKLLSRCNVDGNMETTKEFVDFFLKVARDGK